MKSYFFKPVQTPPRKSIAELYPDEAPAGVAPEAVLFFTVLPKLIQNIIISFVQFFQKILNFIGEVIWQALRGEARAKTLDKSTHDTKESYSTHASFDHLRRIENVEYELAGMRGGLVNKYFKPSVELRLQKLETQVGLRPPDSK